MKHKHDWSERSQDMERYAGSELGGLITTTLPVYLRICVKCGLIQEFLREDKLSRMKGEK